ncbi:MAG: SDR family NAD(P)-dependent oxidoreductase [Bacteroidota bacterium]
MEISLKDKIVLLTGGSRGIGAEIARQLGQSGATVALHYGRSAKPAQLIVDQIGADSRAFQADLNDQLGRLRRTPIMKRDCCS